MATADINQPNPFPKKPGPNPLGWSDETCADVSIYLDRVETIAGMLMAIDGQELLDSLPDGTVCLMMILLDRELQAATDILDKGGAS